MKGAGGHFPGDISCIISKAQNFSQNSGGRTRTVRAVNGSVFRCVPCNVFYRFLSAHDRSCCHDRIYDLLVTRAAAGVPVFGKPFPHVISGGIRIYIKKTFDGHDKSRGTEAALYRAVGNKCLLDRMKMRSCTEAFYGLDPCVFMNQFHLPAAGTHRFSVYQYSTRTALTGSAADLHTGQADSAEKIRQIVLFRITDHQTVYSVDIQIHFFQFLNHIWCPPSLQTRRFPFSFSPCL